MCTEGRIYALERMSKQPTLHIAILVGGTSADRTTIWAPDAASTAGNVGSPAREKARKKGVTTAPFPHIFLHEAYVKVTPLWSLLWLEIWRCSPCRAEFAAPLLGHAAEKVAETVTVS